VSAILGRLIAAYALWQAWRLRKVRRPTFGESIADALWPETSPLTELMERQNTLRQQRLDAAAFQLREPFTYTEGLVDPAELRWGPGIVP
jgi:hypothetical protein